MIPRTYEEWKSCIVEDCKIDLTKAFAQDRLQVYRQAQHTETVKFVSLYGEQHLNNIIHWFTKVGT
jgi:hypothetical protein